MIDCQLHIPDKNQTLRFQFEPVASADYTMYRTDVRPNSGWPRPVASSPELKAAHTMRELARAGQDVQVIVRLT